MDVKIMPERPDAKLYSIIEKETKVALKNNTIDLQIPVTFDLGIILMDEHERFKFEAIREGYVIINLNI